MLLLCGGRGGEFVERVLFSLLLDRPIVVLAVCPATRTTMCRRGAVLISPGQQAGALRLRLLSRLMHAVLCCALVCCAVLLPHGTRGRLWEALAAALLTSTVSFLLPMMVACQVGCLEVPAKSCTATKAANCNLDSLGCSLAHTC